MSIDNSTQLVHEVCFPNKNYVPIPGNKKDRKYDKKEDHLPYYMGFLNDELKEMAEKELKETDDRKEACLKKFRKLITAEKNFYVRTDDSCLLAYLRGKKFDVSRAFKMMQNTYKLRMKKSFYDSPDNSIVHEVFKQNFIGFLPHRAKNGSAIFVVKLGQWDPEKVDRDLLMWVATHCVIHSIEDPATQVAGYTGIIDVRGVSQKHLKMLTLENILLIIYSTMSCFPGRYKGAHVIGMPKFFQVAWNMVYPFVFTLKMQKRIFIHGNDLKSLHKHISPSILPEEYGGELPPFDNSWWHKMILENNEWALDQRLYGYMKAPPGAVAELASIPG
ncbi:clavesin-2-like [Parasteatoda tepidariorum]|uniref:clavesin-2-like n=1 Tax=Parasteatoda tepidariorum TaxID=114398 RepID=UPI00077FAFF4|nr:clavesin-2-like [Parasteatoda tepidariorum]XP_015909535.1 clavesin-2-like [Parasteatoda tepidariorum]XP_015909536.1 clavesin-2-like [Parasteatoda tepidariorum]